MNLQTLQNLVRSTLSQAEMQSSARLCLTRSIELRDKDNDYQASYLQALLALKYTIGILDPRYIRAAK